MSSAEDRPGSGAEATGSSSATAAPAAGSRWSSLVARGGGLVDRLTGSVVAGVKEVARSPLLKQALDARERGNRAAAFHLLVEEFGQHPEEEDVASAFWDVALAYGRPAEAARAVASLICRHAPMGSGELAIQYWVEFCGAVPDALVEPSALARIAPQLIESWQAEEDETLREERQGVMLCALRAIVHPDNEDLATGVAMRTAELAREIDPETALSAARSALQCDDLHEAKRQRLSALVAELESGSGAGCEVAVDSKTVGATEPAAVAASDPPSPDSAPDPTLDSAPDPTIDSVLNSALNSAPDPTPDAMSESEMAKSHPALNHPLHDSCEPSPGLSDGELEALRKKLDRVASPVVCPTPANGETSASGVQFVSAADGNTGAAKTPLVAHVEIPRYADVKVMTAKPTKLDDVGLCLDVGGGRRGRVEYRKIQAVVMARVAGIANEPVQLIDLLLNWNTVDGAPLRLLRLREDDFDPCRVVQGYDDRTAALQALVAEILERTRAVSLPDPDAVLGVAIPTFDSLAEYERDVLQIGV